MAGPGVLAPKRAHLPEKAAKIWQVPVFWPRKGLTCQKKPQNSGRSYQFQPQKHTPLAKNAKYARGYPKARRPDATVGRGMGVGEILLLYDTKKGAAEAAPE